MPSFPSQNFTGNPISRSYSRVVQSYTPTGETYYFLNGTGSVMFSFRSASFGQELMTAERVVTSSLSASLAATTISASYALAALSASYAPSSPTISASYAETASNAISASYAPSSPSVSASYAATASQAISASYAPSGGNSATASYVANAAFTASAVQVHVNYDGASGALYLNSIIGTDNVGTQLLAIRPDGIVATPSWGDGLFIYDVNLQGEFSGSHTGSLLGTASYAESASHLIPGANISASNLIIGAGVGGTLNLVGSAIFGSGLGTVALAAFAQGDNCNAADYAHAQGSQTIAEGIASHAEGQETIAVGNYAHTSGFRTIGSGSHQSVTGRYNRKDNTTSLFIIGNGVSNASRSDLALFNSQSITFSQPLTCSRIVGTASVASYADQTNNLYLLAASGDQDEMLLTFGNEQLTISELSNQFHFNCEISSSGFLGPLYGLATSATSASYAATASILQGDVVSIVGETASFSSFRMTGSYTSTIDTHYTMSGGDNGKMLIVNQTGSVKLAVSSSLPYGFSCTVYQSGSATSSLMALENTTIRNRQGHLSTAGQYAVISLLRVGSGDFILTGDTAT